MTLPRLDAMRDYWRLNPPLHQLYATYIGYKAPPKQEKPGTLEDFVKALGGIQNG